MKSILTTILSFLYLASTTGASLNIHYCMGKLLGVDSHQDAACGRCGMKKSKEGCCKDEVKIIKVTDSHQTAHADISLMSLAEIVPSYGQLIPAFDFVGAHESDLRNNSPPAVSRPLYIFNCIFRI